MSASIISQPSPSVGQEHIHEQPHLPEGNTAHASFSYTGSFELLNTMSFHQVHIATGETKTAWNEMFSQHLYIQQTLGIKPQMF